MKQDQKILLSVKDASKIYQMGEVQVAALRDCTIDIYQGEFLTIVGPSGSGKSTLLNLIGGMDRPTSGQVIFFNPRNNGSQGEDLTQFSDRKLTLFRRSEIGFVFQFFNLIPTLTALENVQVAIEVVDEPLDAFEALKHVGLDDRADHFPSQLSGGQQQRVAIARALASNPTILLCDEPTGALDSKTSKLFIELLLELNQKLNKTIVMITHENNYGALAHRVAEIHDGEITKIERHATPATVEQIEW